MKKVLAITVVLMIAAIVLTPALGFTNQAAGNQSYTAKSGEYVDGNFKIGAYSIESGVPAHNMTSAMAADKYSFKSAGIQGISFKTAGVQGTKVPYSIRVESVGQAVALGSSNKKAEEAVVAPEEKVPTTTPAVEPAPVEQPKFTIEGMVFDDVDGSSVMDNNETGLAGWTINLEQPAGTVLNSLTTDSEGKFAFKDLAEGEYVVSEVMQTGWKAIAPVDGKFSLTLTNESATNLVFANSQE